MKRLLIIFIAAITLQAQTKDAAKILKDVETKFSKVKDYTADVVIKLDASFIKMPPSKVKVYFKQPDKVHLQSDGFSMIPKQSIRFSPSLLLKEDFMPVYVKGENLNGKKVDVINLLPKSDTVKTRLLILWIDSDEKVIRKLETLAKAGGTVTTEFEYGDEIKYGLPSQIKFSMDLKGIHLPRMRNPGKDKNAEKDNKDNIGTAIITYSNYSINKGIDDKIFKEEKK